ncbi:MAG: Mov34/MPN/PAD-1 family protein [Acidimicrobiia bacterium]|jgi:proteasome lid subunit RPN8/RPN11|nr:MAG: Mov34/MPN/PAD-1 family protein [Acidimicrobiia bacterium]
MSLRLPAQIKQAMLVHAENCYPEEACGLVAGDRRGLRMAYPLTNVLASPTNYTIDPVEHFRALKHAERQGWELVGVFHSHPHSQAYPSPTDVRLAPDPEWVYFLIGLADRDRPQLRAFRIHDGTITEIDIEEETR